MNEKLLYFLLFVLVGLIVYCIVNNSEHSSFHVPKSCNEGPTELSFGCISDGDKWNIPTHSNGVMKCDKGLCDFGENYWDFHDGTAMNFCNTQQHNVQSGLRVGSHGFSGRRVGHKNMLGNCLLTFKDDKTGGEVEIISPLN